MNTTDTPSISLGPASSTISSRLFWLVLAIQVGLIFSLPLPTFYTLLNGTTVMLKTAPVDPYDFLRGYYQTLNYDISNIDNLSKLPGWSTLQAQTAPTKRLEPGTPLYVTLQASTETKKGQPLAVWKPIAVSSTLPMGLPPGQIALTGKVEAWGGRVKYGLEKYYMPEQYKDGVNRDILTSQSIRTPNSLIAEVKIDRFGHATLISLWVGAKNYKF